jgi:hypothetical protein
MTTTHDHQSAGHTRRVLPLAAATLTGLLLTTSPAHASSTHTTDDFDFDADGLCAFTVHLAVHDEADIESHATARGSVEIDKVTETDTISANGVTIVGLPYRYAVTRTFDSAGNQLTTIAHGEEWRFPLPGGGVFSAGGRNDFLTGEVVGSWSFDDGLGPVCDALAG